MPVGRRLAEIDGLVELARPAQLPDLVNELGRVPERFPGQTAIEQDRIISPPDRQDGQRTIDHVAERVDDLRDVHVVTSRRKGPASRPRLPRGPQRREAIVPYGHAAPTLPAIVPREARISQGAERPARPLPDGRRSQAGRRPMARGDWAMGAKPCQARFGAREWSQPFLGAGSNPGSSPNFVGTSSLAHAAYRSGRRR